ncbi:response regulator [Stenotrophomonas sp. C1657]|uniref:response regulator n=1 Tax=Stenotrophomonas sp. C1657 TaxID=3077844 RepID=UPI00293C8317|nr:response regulator [Stenotrophomonas sp. C1657]MDV3514078.1 response regulator [Stenotrophomonas sp. C1657]
MSHPIIRVAVADDHPVIRMGIEAAIDEIPTLSCIGAVGDSSALIALLEHTACDVVVTDYAMPGGAYGDGLQLLSHLRTHFPDLRLIVMTGLDQPAMIQSLHASGINHILSKADDTSHVPAAIAAAWANRRYLSPSIAQLFAARGPARAVAALSPREHEVLVLFVSGLSINEIATRLDRRKQTISTQKTTGMAKLGIERDADLFKFASELGLRTVRPDVG